MEREGVERACVKKREQCFSLIYNVRKSQRQNKETSG